GGAIRGVPHPHPGLLSGGELGDASNRLAPHVSPADLPVIFPKPNSTAVRIANPLARLALPKANPQSGGLGVPGSNPGAPTTIATSTVSPLVGIQLQQVEIALAAGSSAEHDWYRGAVRKLRSSTRRDAAWLGVLLCYCAVFGGILLYSNFLPYTFDNNESFSAFCMPATCTSTASPTARGLPTNRFPTPPPRIPTSTLTPARARACLPISCMCWASGRSSCRSR